MEEVGKNLVQEKLLKSDSCVKSEAMLQDKMDAGGQKSRPGFAAFVLVCCFFSQALSMGFFVSFGTIYVELIKIFKTSETTAAWIGSIAMSTCFAIGCVTSFIIKKFGCGATISLGGLLLGLGLILSSLAENITILALTFSGLTSIGCSFLFFASLSALPLYFKSGLCLATSVVCSGSNFSGITFSPMTAFLIKNYGFKTCFQIFSTAAVIPIIGGLIMQRFGEPPKEIKRTSNETKGSYKSLLTNKRLLVVFVAMSLIELCYYIPYVHLVNFGIHNGIPLLKASWLPVILSIGGWIGKIIFGFIGQIKYLNIVYLFQIFILSMAVCLTLLPLATTFSHLITFSVIYGIFDGAFTGFVFPVVATTVPKEQIGMAFGTLYTFISVEILFGAPLAGFIYSQTASYQIPFLLCGGILLLATLVFFWLPEKDIEMESDEKSLIGIDEKKAKIGEITPGGKPQARRNKVSLLRNLSTISKKMLKLFNVHPKEQCDNERVVSLSSDSLTNDNLTNQIKRDRVSKPIEIPDNCKSIIDVMPSVIDPNNNDIENLNPLDTQIAMSNEYELRHQIPIICTQNIQEKITQNNTDSSISCLIHSTAASSRIATESNESTIVEIHHLETIVVVSSGVQRNNFQELFKNLYHLRLFIDGYLSILLRAMQRQFTGVEQQSIVENSMTMCQHP